ncbi:MAG: FHA domain-containing protein [Bacteroidetes Order II. Incertae sedis bacterium]|nr:FHA domain-containing protein [Bacteroidetes Order II. bacterium]
MRERRFTIGRGSSCDIVLADATVSRLHATLTLLEGGRLLLTDCHSANGTKVFVKGNPLKITHELVLPGDSVQFGDIVWEVNDMLKALWLKNPNFDPANYSHPQDVLRSGYDPTKLSGLLVMCKSCHYLKPKGETCPNCLTSEANTPNDG